MLFLIISVILADNEDVFTKQTGFSLVKTHGNLLVKGHKLELRGKQCVEIFAKILVHVDATSSKRDVI